MNVGISAIGFRAGEMGGTETYFRNLLYYLKLSHRENNYNIVFDNKRIMKLFDIDDSFMKSVSYNFCKPSIGWFFRGIISKALNFDLYKMVLDGLNLDLIHYPFTVLSPKGIKTPTVLTFWDMQHEYYPKYFSSVDLEQRNACYRPSVELSTRIIVSAKFTKQCLIEKYGVSPDKIDIVYTGYGPEYRVLDDNDVQEEIISKYGFDRPFIFYPAATWPHKNHRTLLAALKILRERKLFDGLLVLTGITKQSQDVIRSDIVHLGLSGVVRLLGYLPSQELPFLYNRARAMVFPSLFEGFGIPVVEAMACGCPVICSNATSLPEVVGGAGIMFNPRSAEEMAEKISLVWTDDKLRSDMRSKGLERVKCFSWENTARQTLEVYKKAIA